MKYDRMKIDRKKLNLMMARKLWSTRDLAKAAGFSYETLRRAVSTKSVGATPLIAGKIAAALGVDVTEIIEEEE